MATCPLSLKKHFRNLRDPRLDRRRQHQFLDIIAIALCAGFGFSRLTVPVLDRDGFGIDARLRLSRVDWQLDLIRIVFTLHDARIRQGTLVSRAEFSFSLEEQRHFMKGGKGARMPSSACRLGGPANNQPLPQ